MTSLLINGNALHIPLADCAVQCVVTSPPYWGLRDYSVSGQLGLERVPDCLGWATKQPCGECFVCHMVQVFREVRRVLRDDGTVFLNLGDSFFSDGQRHTGRNDTNRETPGGRGGSFRGGVRHAISCDTSGLKPKDLIGIPWRVALALQADGWYLRSDIIWAKPNPMPESVTDRPTKAHEYIFLLSKQARYFWDADAVKEPANPDHFGRYKYEFWPEGTKEESGGGRPGGASNTGGIKDYDGKRNIRTVWTLATQPTKEAHFATFPEKLVEPCIKAGSRIGDVVFDPFAGSGTVARVSIKLGRRAVGTELSMTYLLDIAKRRTDGLQPIMFEAV